MISGTTPHLLNPSPIAQGVVERRIQGVGDEAECIKEVALARAVGTDQERERPQANIASRDTLVIAEPDSGHEGRLVHGAVSLRDRSCRDHRLCMSLAL
jgi:hypothetical protein